MTISFQYNWPPGFVRVSMGQANIEDHKYSFRLGVVKKADQKVVFWQGPAEWLAPEQADQIEVDLERGDIIVLDRKGSDNNIDFRHKWDTEKDWPLEAHGPSSTHVPYYV
jgi:hypothetical protein